MASFVSMVPMGGKLCFDTCSTAVGGPSLILASGSGIGSAAAIAGNILGYYHIRNLYRCLAHKNCQFFGQLISSESYERSTSDTETNEEIEYVKSSEEHLKARAAYIGDRSNINHVVGYNETAGQCAVCMAGSSLLLLQNVSCSSIFQLGI